MIYWLLYYIDILHITAVQPGTVVIPEDSAVGHQDALGQTQDAIHDNAETLAETMEQFTAAEKEDWGHQYNDFILRCTFEGYDCKP